MLFRNASAKHCLLLAELCCYAFAMVCAVLTQAMALPGGAPVPEETPAVCEEACEEARRDKAGAGGGRRQEEVGRRGGRQRRRQEEEEKAGGEGGRRRRKSKRRRGTSRREADSRAGRRVFLAP
eukprot:211217-Rhodomonas_salina.2